MRCQILTLFPELFEPFFSTGLVGRAVREGLMQVETTQLRDYAINTQGQIDDTPYGGGSGMVLRCDAAANAIREAKQKNPSAKVILFTPRGKPLTQARARAFARDAAAGFILLCPRYEGVDERIAEQLVDEELCIGDYVLMGGEVPAMTFIEAVVRLVPGVLGNPESIAHESFETAGILEHPHYTKPQDFEGHSVPDVLLSGNHAEINKWRETRARADTLARRPELAKGPLKRRAGLSVALIHYPVLNKEGKIITSSITNIDVHDIARSSCTYGLDRYYVVHPVRTLRRLVDKICDHWEVGYGASYNPNRGEALKMVSLVPDFDDVLLDIETRTGRMPTLISSSARRAENTISFQDMRQRLAASDEQFLLLLGTGWGLAPEIMERATYRLEPIHGPGEYNHLSVRAAAAILLDRLIGG